MPIPAPGSNEGSLLQQCFRAIDEKLSTFDEEEFETMSIAFNDLPEGCKVYQHSIKTVYEHLGWRVQLQTHGFVFRIRNA